MVVIGHDRISTATITNSLSTFAATAVNGTWSNPSDTQLDNNIYATDVWDSALGANGDILDCTELGRQGIPSTATITGITVRISRKGSAPSILKDLTVQLIKGGTAQGDNKASASSYGGGEAVATYGSSSDLWSLTLTPDDVMAADFGVRFQPQTTAVSGSVTVSIDLISIQVHYTLAAAATIAALDGSDLSWLWEYDIGVNGIGRAWIPANPLIDEDGNVYVKSESLTDATVGAMHTQVRLQKFDSAGSLLWTWNSGTLHTGAGSVVLQYAFNSRVCFDLSGNVVIAHRRASSGDYIISVVDMSGSTVQQIVYPGGGGWTNVSPHGIGVDSSGNFFVAGNATSGDSPTIAKYDSAGTFVTSVSAAVRAMVVDSVNDVIYHQPSVSSGATTAVVIRKRLCSDLSEVWNKRFVDINSGVSGSNQFALPVEIAVNSDDGRVYGAARFLTGTTVIANNFTLDSAGNAVFNTAVGQYLNANYILIDQAAFDEPGGTLFYMDGGGTSLQPAPRICKFNLADGSANFSGYNLDQSAGSPKIYGIAAGTF